MTADEIETIPQINHPEDQSCMNCYYMIAQKITKIKNVDVNVSWFKTETKKKICVDNLYLCYRFPLACKVAKVDNTINPDKWCGEWKQGVK